MSLFWIYTLNALQPGMIYAAVALGLVLVWRSTRILNFAQGAMAMLTTYLAYTALEHQVPYWAAVAVAVAGGFLIGGITERLVIRPVENRSPMDAVIISIGVLIFIEALAGGIWGSVQRGLPARFSLRGLASVGGQRVVSPFDLYVIVSVLVVMALLLLLFRFTALGLRMRATAFAPEVARLLGVRVNRMLTLGWALASAVGALAGIFVAPTGFLYPSNMDTVFIYGFTAAIVGGLESPIGALVGGLAMGLVFSYVTGYLNPSYATSGAVVLLVVVLMVRPSGLFAAAPERRV
jgi:branched-chain amino acid transport system permease protein